VTNRTQAPLRLHFTPAISHFIARPKTAAAALGIMRPTSTFNDSGDRMTPHQITLVRSSFALVSPIADSAASLFYSRLFELDPSLRPLFKTNLESQGNKLMGMLASAVALLDQPE
jgi:hypothetical protein